MVHCTCRSLSHLPYESADTALWTAAHRAASLPMVFSSSWPLQVGKETLFVVIDGYSRWIEMKFCTSTLTSAIINRLKDVIATDGIIDELLSESPLIHQCEPIWGTHRKMPTNSPANPHQATFFPNSWTIKQSASPIRGPKIHTTGAMEPETSLPYIEVNRSSWSWTMTRHGTSLAWLFMWIPATKPTLLWLQIQDTCIAITGISSMSLLCVKAPNHAILCPPSMGARQQWYGPTWLDL